MKISHLIRNTLALAADICALVVVTIAWFKSTPVDRLGFYTDRWEFWVMALLFFANGVQKRCWHEYE